jgi:hypothetical protein
MARIRSIHPGLWTDEAFVSLSPFGRLFYLGLLNECDDMGSFDWAPIKLKMRLLPADNVSADELLTELMACGQVMSYEVGEKRYGAIRNFCQYQRPKKPTSVYPQPEAVGKWVNTSARSTRDGGEPDTPSKGRGGEPKGASTKGNGEAVGKQLPTGGEKSRQRKEGGDSSVTNVTGADAPPVDPGKVLFDAGIALLTAAGLSQRNARSLVAKWRQAQGDEAVSAAIVSAAGKSEPVAWIEARFRTISTSEDEAAAVSHARAERYRRMNMAGPPPSQPEGLH